MSLTEQQVVAFFFTSVCFHYLRTSNYNQESECIFKNTINSRNLSISSSEWHTKQQTSFGANNEVKQQ